MSKIQLALDVVGDMRTLADSIEVLAHAMAEGEQGDEVQASSAKQPVEAAIPTALETPAEPKLTLVDLRAFVAERSTPENRPKIKAIINRFGVNKLTELSEDQYEAVKREVAAL